MQVDVLNERFRVSAVRLLWNAIVELMLNKTAAIGAATLIFCISLFQPGLALAAPTITSISHSTGSILGGTTVTITGTELTGATSVTFGGLSAGDVTVLNATTVTAVTPARVLPGSVTVTVTTPTGTASRANFFTYVLTPAPTVLLGTPLIGSTAGGTSVVLTGTNFTGATSVSFGGTSTTDFTILNPSTIRVNTPPHAAGLVSVAVTGPGGTGTGLGLFTYLPAPPTVLLAAPLVGPTAGGTSVTITGLNFSNASAVSFGGTAATSFTVVNDVTITATAPPHSAGLVNVAVTTAGGIGTGIGLFTYLPAPPTVILATPLTGPAAGGTIVTIKGTNFSGATAVAFGGTAATNFSIVDDTTITATAPPHAAGIVNVAVTTAGGIGTGIGLFTYLPALPPSVALATPIAGPTTGGTVVTITGGNFTGATSVNFGGTAATSFTVVDNGTITATAPAHVVGLVTISVTSPAGTGLGAGLFTYLPTAPPTVLLAAPLTGPISGGTSVTITGTNFTGATSVSFGDTAATSFAIVNDNTITAVAPPHSVGLVNISVTSPQGTGLRAGLYTYLPTAAPSVLLATPLSGPASGGTIVTLRGLNFTGATAVSFGGTPATGVTVIDDTTITAVAPAHAAGPVTISVTSPAGTGIQPGLFVYDADPIPAVLLVSPLVGSAGASTRVTITGLNFTTGSTVAFGNVPAANVVVASPTTIEADAPPLSAGVVNVSVTTAAGTGLGLGLFTYLPTLPPSAIVTLPLTGSVAGGTPVTIRGLSLTGATAVRFGGQPATNVTVVNDTTISAITPAHDAGLVDVQVVGPAGTGTGTGVFTYLPTGAPTVALVGPLFGDVTGGTPVTITGFNFTGATGVNFGGVPATSVVVVNNTTINAVSPAHPAGPVDVSVTSPNGTGLQLGIFTYVPTLPPAITLVAPPIGPISGGTSVIITGLNFSSSNNSTTIVRFDGIAATSTTVINDTTIRATSPPHVAGLVDVTVQTPRGTSPIPGLFTYLPIDQPTVTLAAPLVGDNSGGTSVQITGINFTGATAVHFGDTPATSFTVNSDISITAFSPAHPTGLVNISVTTQAGTGLGLGLFTYLPVSAPTVLAVTPLAGPAAGGVPVTITGANFTDNSGPVSVSFGGTLSTDVTVVNDNTIVVTTPPHSAGVVSVAVTSSKGTGTGIYTYLPALPPSPLIVSPLTGSTTGGELVTIDGANFTGTTSVQFGGVAATNVTVVDDGRITVRTPAHAAGPVSVTVSSPAGTGIAATPFLYLPAAAPTVLAALPPTGPSGGGTAVTIIGTNFTGATAVNFGSTVMASGSFTVVNDTTITLTSPAGPVGIASVSVTNGVGTGPGLGIFTYLPELQPTILTVTPPGGPAAGGTTVTITGINLNGVTDVSFGGTPATGVTVISNTQVTAVSPAHVGDGIVDVSVTSPDGTGSLPLAFTYIATSAPRVFLVTPPIGTTAGGQTVTITGLNFTAPASVSFGTTPATDVVVVNSTTITAKSPAHSLGVVNVTVDTSAGQGIGLGLYTYLTVDIPVVALVTPPIGPPAGGTAVTITGVNFTGTTAVNFGLTPATSFTVVNDMTITAITPAAGSVGIVNVSVTTPAGPGIGAGLFTYLTTNQPIVGLVDPLTGLTTGGEVVQIDGLNLTGATSVSFGGVPAASFNVDSDISITALTPPHAVGPVNVTVTTPAGSGISTGIFTYLPAAQPSVLLVSPLTGPPAGGTNVTITGVNFTGATGVSFGGTPAGPFVIVNDTTITTTTPSHDAGIVNVTVSSANGTGIGLGLFTYLPAARPTVLAALPASGPTTGGTSVTITGMDFNGATGVSFGGIPATNVIVNSNTSITATSPAHVAGLTDVSVTTPAGSGLGLGLFNYVTASLPAVLSTNPPTGPSTGGTSVTITGANFDGVTSVGFGGVPATSMTVMNNSTIIAIAPPHAAGVVNISASSPSGTGIGFGVFTYLPTAQPQVVSANPAAGPATGGTSVTITGSNFTGTTNVYFDTTPATSVSIIDDGTITATSPAHAVGTVNISVASPLGTGIGPALFTYLPTTGPAVTSLSPTSGPVTGGTVVTITGSSLTGTTAVTFGGATASNIVVINDTIITAIAPARSAGSVVVSVTTPVGTAIAASLFTYADSLRPDPSLDPEVLGIVNAQAASATRFARNQMRNFHGRLERLHNERDRAAASMDIRLGLPSQQRRDRRDREDEEILDELVGRDPASTSYGYGSGGQSPLRSLTNAGASNGPASETREYNKLAFWSGGFVNFGNGDDEGFDIGHTTVGISGGVDYRFTDRFVAGIGIGYGRDRADIGDNGTESKAHAFSAAVYSSFEIIDNFFLDALVGGSTLSFDSKRYITANGEFATGNRSGSQIFASVTAAYEIREETWLVSPYGRVEFSRSFLDRYSEEGGGIYDLTYGSQTIDTVSGVIGLRANMSFETDWAILTPGLRLEYTHDFEGTSDAKLGYKDLGTLPYEIEGRDSRQDFITVGLSLDMQFDNNWDLAFEYRARFGNDGDTDHNVGVQLRAKF